MNKNLSHKKLLAIIEQALEDKGISAREASMRAVGTPELIRNMRRGSIPSVERFRALCDVLELEFYIGPVRSHKFAKTPALGKRDAMYNMLQEIISRLPHKRERIKTAEPFKPYGQPKLDDFHHIPAFETGTAASGTSFDEDKQVTSHIAFHANWLRKHNLDPQHCIIVQVGDESMEPTIAKHAMVLIDRSRHRRLIGHIYAIRNADNLMIRRLDKNKDGWQLVGDHPKCKAVPLPASAEIIGEVKWMAKSFE